VSNPRCSISAQIITVSVLLGCAAGALAQSPELPGWRLVWADEFPGTTYSPNNWNAENVAWPYNNELEFYLPQQATVSNGILDIKTERRNYNGRNYVSARLNTSGHFSQQYGRFEARIKMPIGQGIWPAFWLLPEPLVWPPEIDIVEMIGNLPNTLYFTHHWGTVSNVMSHGITYTGPNYTTEYHRYAVEWSGSRIDWIVDDVVRFSTTANVPQVPMHVLLNLAVGGNLPGNPTPATVFPQSMLVDWVRVYMRDAALLNPGFETLGTGNTPASWVSFGNAQQSTTAPNSGTKSAQLNGIAGSGPYYSGIFQDLPASPGQAWTATAFGQHISASRLVSGNYVDLKIEWYNSAGQQVGVDAVMALSNTSPTDTFVPSSVQAIAPASTARARVAIIYVQTGAAGGTAYMDDVTFSYSTPGPIQTCAADYNGSGGLSVQDIFDFLAAYFSSNPRGDFNGVAGITVQDIFDFLASYFAGCTG